MSGLVSRGPDPTAVARRAEQVSRERYVDSARTFRSTRTTTVLVAMYIAFGTLPLWPGSQLVSGDAPAAVSMALFAGVAAVTIACWVAYRRGGPLSPAYQVASVAEAASWLGTATVLAIASGKVASIYQAQPMTFVVLLSGSTWRTGVYRGLLVAHVVAVSVGFAVFESTGAGLAALLLALVWMLIHMLSVRSGRHLDLAQARAQLFGEQLAARERARIARALHDGLASDITQVLWMASTQESAEGRELMARLKDTLAALRAITARIRSEPGGIRHLGEELRALTDKTARAAQVVVELDLDLPAADAQVDTAVHDAVVLGSTELIRNAITHGRAEHVFVELSVDDDIWLRVSDDGANGPDPPSTAPGGDGLRNLQERTAELGGHVEIEPSPSGWQVTVVLPRIPRAPTSRESGPVPPEAAADPWH